jgi:hypothetical protein
MNIKENKRYTGALLALVLALICINGYVSAQSRAFITEGIFHSRKADLSSGRVALNGNWAFYSSRLLKPSEIKDFRPTSLLVPSLWEEHQNLGSIGYGTYVLKMLLPRAEKWALEIPQLYNSYALYINDTLAASNGRPSETKELAQLQWKPQYVTFKSSSDTTTIVLQLSNFHHAKGGIREPIYLGKSPVIENHFRKAMYSVAVEVAVLCLLGFFFLYLFFKRGKQRITLYFALLCFAWATREMFSDLYPVSSIFPGINWFFLVKTEYISLCAIMAFGILFINRLFIEMSSNVFKYLATFITAVYVVFIVLTPVIVFSRWLPLYLITAVAILLYAGITIVRAMLAEKNGAWFLVSGLLLSLLAMGYDLLAYSGMFSNYIMVGSLLYILTYLCCAIGLLQHLTIIRSSESSSNTLRYQDLYGN